MQYIVFIEASTTGAGEACVRAARELGYQSLLLTRDSSLYAENILDAVNTVISCKTDDIASSISALEPYIERGQIAAIMTTNDFYVLETAKLCNYFGKKGIGLHAASACQDKNRLREALVSYGAGRLNPRYRTFHAEEITELREVFPFILKPIDANDSIGVRLIRDHDDLEKYALWAKNQRLDVTGQPYCKGFLLEELIEGEEFSAEMLACGPGKYSLIGIFIKELWRRPHAPFVKMGAGFPYVGPFAKAIEEGCKDVLAALRAEYGVFNIDCKINTTGEFKILEVNGRMVGDQMASHVIPLASNARIDLLALSVLIEEDFKLPLIVSHRAVGIYRLIAEKEGIFMGINNVHEIMQSPGTIGLNILEKIGNRITISNSNQDVIGSVIAEGKNPSDALEKARYAASIAEIII